MVTKVQRWGNSQGLRISRQLLQDVNIAVGDRVDVIARDGVIVVTPLCRVRGKCDLLQLVARIPKDYAPEETDWGGAVGKEVW